MAIERGTATECYCVCCEGLGSGYREELILNITVFFVRVWGGGYREELIRYREELILNVTLFIVRVWGGRYR